MSRDCSGVTNVVTGFGEIVGTELTKSPDVMKIALHPRFRPARSENWRQNPWHHESLTLELGGKSPTSSWTTPISPRRSDGINACYLNNGQACMRLRA